MKRFLILAAAMAGIVAAADQQTFTGVITDTMCGTSHAMTPGQPDDKCVAMCVKGTTPCTTANQFSSSVIRGRPRSTPHSG